ncbi:MAG: DUF1667 domain-containing protein [Pyramidobacter sp.]
MRTIQEYTCVVCPNGCLLRAECETVDGGQLRLVSVAGNLCPRGASWAKQEIEDPRRTISTNLLLEGGTLPVVCVKTAEAIPLKDVMKVREALRSVVLRAPVHIGQIAAVNPAGVPCRIVVTRDVPAKEN